MEKYVNIHLHSQGSLLDGLCKVEEVVNKAMAMGQPASCITDHGNCYSIPDHFKYAQKLDGIKPIAGVELYMTDDHTRRGADEGESEANTKRNHFLLLARNHEGYKKMNRIVSKGYTDGFYYRPRVDNGILEEFMDQRDNDLIGCSACIAGKIPQLILHGDIEVAERLIKYYEALFNGNFYLEIQPTLIYEQFVVNRELIAMSKRLSIPLISTTDAHYLNKEDKETHDVLLCMQSKNTMSNPDRWSFHGNTYYMMSRNELEEAYRASFCYKKIKRLSTKKKSLQEYWYQYVYDYESKYNNLDSINGFVEVVEEGKCNYAELDQNAIHASIDETVEVANKCNVTIEFGKHYLPKITIPNDERFNKWKQKYHKDGNPNEDYLRYLCIQGLKKRGLTSSVYRERLEYELQVINRMGFPDYFLIYYDIANFCRTEDIPMGPGRGCFAPENVVETTNGSKPIENIAVGDKVYGNDENTHQVLIKHEYDVEEELLDVECGDYHLDGITKEHKVYAITKNDYDKGIRIPQWIAIDQLNEGDYICKLEM